MQEHSNLSWKKVCPDIILGTETWLSPDISSSEIFDECLGYDVHRNDRPDNPHGGVLIVAKKDLELHDIKCSKDEELISGTVKISNRKRSFSHRTTDHPISLTSHT